jgi:hypothetical protein
MKEVFKNLIGLPLFGDVKNDSRQAGKGPTLVHESSLMRGCLTPLALGVISVKLENLGAGVL